MTILPDMLGRRRRRNERSVGRAGSGSFSHSSGATDFVELVSLHSLPPDVTPDEVEVPRGYRSRTIADPPRSRTA